MYVLFLLLEYLDIFSHKTSHEWVKHDMTQVISIYLNDKYVYTAYVI